MSGEFPENEEVLTPLSLGESPAGPGKGVPTHGKGVLLTLLLLVWSFGVFHFFSPQSQPEPPSSIATATPLPIAETEKGTPPAQPTSTELAETTPETPPVPTSLPEVQQLIAVSSDPPGAMVLLKEVRVGQTPFDLKEAKPGDSLLFRINGAESQRITVTESHFESGLHVKFELLSAKIRLQVFPETSHVFLDGKEVSLPENGVLTLPLRIHQLEVRADGYETRQLTFIPAQAYERLIQVRLQTREEKQQEAVGAEISGPVSKVEQGLEMVLPEFPLEGTQGSARGTPGRQSNEVELKLRLTRPFRISKTEISNADYRKFKPTHRSPSWQGVNLDADVFPVTGVSWEDAVAYCNWLSEQAGLPPVYVKTAGGWTLADNEGTGYRLPTEAEWELLARQEAGDQLYGWGNQLPPEQGSVNLAGKESAKRLTLTMENFVDPFVGPAPVSKAGQGPFALLGLYGNVREWVQDAYGIPDLYNQVQVDPEAKVSGKFHVIKGASWQDAGFVDLRIARRRYGSQSAPDLGFRVARFIAPQK